MTQYEVRRLNRACLDQLMEIELSSFTLPWSKESYEEEITANDMAVYIGVFADDKLLGYGGFWHIVDEAHINNIAVHPEYRRQGIGKMLMQSLITLAQSLGCVSMTLEVRISNHAAKMLYEQLGFRSVGVRPHYYHDNNEDADIMWLHFYKN